MTQPDQSLAFARAYTALTMLVAATPPRLQFAGWPLALPTVKPSTHQVPAADILKSWADG